MYSTFLIWFLLIRIELDNLLKKTTQKDQFYFPCPLHTRKLYNILFNTKCKVTKSKIIFCIIHYTKPLLK